MVNKYLKSLSSLLFVLLASLSLSAQTGIVIRLENPLSVERKEVVSIAWSDIQKQYPQINDTKVVVTDLRTATEVVYQLERKGEKQIQNLLIFAEILPNGYREYKISEGTPSIFPTKTFCRYVPERKDDFAWENDRVAFRMYGKALEGTSGNAYGIDVWTKYVDYPVIDRWYKLDNYHVDNGEGHDFYKVGLTLGAGDIAPYENGKIWYPNNYRRWTVLDNGPLRSTFCLEYDAWDVNGRQVTVSKTVSIDAGSQLNKVEADYKWNDNKPLSVVAGVVKRAKPGTMLLNEQDGILAYWEPVYGKSEEVGTCCIFPNAATMQVVDGQIWGAVQIEKPGKVSYYNGAAWNKAGIITSHNDWFDYLNASKLIIDNPIKISLKK